MKSGILWTESKYHSKSLVCVLVNKYKDMEMLGKITSCPRYDTLDAISKRYRLDGVREYWELDPEDRIVTKVLFEEGRFETYSFDDAIPVHIFNGECVINLGEF